MHKYSALLLDTETGGMTPLPYTDELTARSINLLRMKQLGQEKCDLETIMIHGRAFVINTVPGQHKQLVLIINDQGRYSFISDQTLGFFKAALHYQDGKFTFDSDNYSGVQLGQETLF